MSSTILAYAFLRAFYNQGAQNPLDALIPLVKRALVNASKPGAGQTIDQQAVQRNIRERIGLDIPINVIRYTFPSLAKEGIVELDKVSYTYRLRFGLTVDDEVKKIEKSARDMYSRLVSNAQKVIDAENSRDFLADELIEYWLDTSALSFLGTSNPAYNADRKDRESNRLIALALKDPIFGLEFLNDLTEIAMGDCLFRAIKSVTEYDLEQTSDEEAATAINATFKKRMDRVDVYFDTRFVLRSIGFVSEDFKKATEEVLALCRSTGAQICVFDHTVDEVKRIIETVANRIKYSQAVEGDIAYYAYENGLEFGDLIDLAAQVAEKIKGVGFKIQSAPPITPELSVNEKDLDERLRIDLRQENELARITDIRSLTGIYRLRQGRQRQHLEDCDAIFITTNKGLADSSVRFYRNEFDKSFPRNRVQICMTDVVFSTRLWAKLPTTFDRLPRQQVISHVLGNLRPSKGLREAFAKQLRDLVARGKLSDESATRLRLSRFTDEVLALEFESNTNQIAVSEAIDVANKIIRKQKELWERIKIESAETARSKLQSEIDELSIELSKLNADLTVKNDGLSALEEEIGRRGREIEVLARKEARVREKIERIIPWITRTIGFVCVFWMFNVFFGMIPSLSSVLDAVGWVDFASFARGLGLWSERIAAAVMGLLTLGGLSLVGFQKRMENWCVKKSLEFVFD